MKALMTTLVLWLSANFNLPATEQHPRIEFAPAAKIAALRYRGLSGGQLAVPSDRERQVLAVYDDEKRVIHLREGWTGSTPAEVSILVHEMVHHLQNIANVKFACPEEREQLAYLAQEKWLNLFGSDLQSDFKIDSFSLLVKTKCLH